MVLVNVGVMVFLKASGMRGVLDLKGGWNQVEEMERDTCS